jgi:hypothetical protein
VPSCRLPHGEEDRQWIDERSEDHWWWHPVIILNVWLQAGDS